MITTPAHHVRLRQSSFWAAALTNPNCGCAGKPVSGSPFGIETDVVVLAVDQPDRHGEAIIDPSQPDGLEVAGFTPIRRRAPDELVEAGLGAADRGVDRCPADPAAEGRVPPLLDRFRATVQPVAIDQVRLLRRGFRAELQCLGVQRGVAVERFCRRVRRAVEPPIHPEVAGHRGGRAELVHPPVRHTGGQLISISAHAGWGLDESLLVEARHLARRDQVRRGDRAGRRRRGGHHGRHRGRRLRRIGCPVRSAACPGSTRFRRRSPQRSLPPPPCRRAAGYGDDRRAGAPVPPAAAGPSPHRRERVRSARSGDRGQPRFAPSESPSNFANVARPRDSLALIVPTGTPISAATAATERSPR